MIRVEKYAVLLSKLELYRVTLSRERIGPGICLPRAILF